VDLRVLPRHRSRLRSRPRSAASLDAANEPAVVITQGALAEEFPICVRTLELFVRCYGSEAANLALKSNAIRRRISDRRHRAGRPDRTLGRRVHARVHREGALRGLHAPHPVRLVLCKKAPLLGARAVATAAR
jgi:hypothetical protein